jgi:GNAT superfamily N-acetyltransferase
MDFINLTTANIDDEHICCGFSDKKIVESYAAKKTWLKKEFERGYRFYRLDERAKVFIEYGPAESAWLPVEAEDLFNINCFWVSGKYKGHGYAKILLRQAEKDARSDGRAGLMTVTGRKKYHFMSDGKWFIKQGFEIVDETETGFILLVKIFDRDTKLPQFTDTARKGICPNDKGLTAYYSNRCPFAEYHVTENLTATAKALNLPLEIIKFQSLPEVKAAPSPATIFSLFKDGKFLTTDVGICLENRFVKAFGRKEYETRMEKA